MRKAEARERLVAAVRRRLTQDPTGDALLAACAAEPTPENQRALEKHLASADLDQDEEILDLLTAAGPSGPTAVGPGSVAAQVIVQVVYSGAGYIGGTHPAGTVTEASRQATRQGRVVGRPINEWSPAALRVHDSITVHDETSPTPYILRVHDQQLRQVLQQAAASHRPTLVLVVGTSCSGKTRSLYEAATAALPAWLLTAPKDDSDLAKTLLDGVPAGTVLWLDELQDLLPATPSGITAAKAIAELLNSDVGPMLFVGTLWPANLIVMKVRADPAAASAGAGAIPDLLAHAAVVEVPDAFTETDLDRASVTDARLQRAIATAARTDHPDRRKVTQVLAGGAQLVNRLYPTGEELPYNAFSPAARAILRAACDLRRFHVPSPLPRWAIEGAAPGYLDPPDHRPIDFWFSTALDETTEAARNDDPLVHRPRHDNHRGGVPALTPRWIPRVAAPSVEAYEVHDYLVQEHSRQQGQATPPHAFWSTIASHAADIAVSRRLWFEARCRGLFTTAIAILDALEPLGELGAAMDRAWLLVDRGGESSYARLHALADSGDRAARRELRELFLDVDGNHRLTELYKLAGGDPETSDDAGPARGQIAAMLRRRGDQASLMELRARADAGEIPAQWRLGEWLVAQGSPSSLEELRSRADAGAEPARRHWAEVLFNRGGPNALAELGERATAGDEWGQYFCSKLLALVRTEAAVDELRIRAVRDEWMAAEYLAEMQHVRLGTSALHALRERAKDDDRGHLARLLAARGDSQALDELRERAHRGESPAIHRLAEMLAATGTDDALDEFRSLVPTGVALLGTRYLSLVRGREQGRHVLELDCEAMPVFESGSQVL